MVSRPLSVAGDESGDGDLDVVGGVDRFEVLGVSGPQRVNEEVDGRGGGEGAGTETVELRGEGGVLVPR
jgi:hypothetical protein